MTEAISRNESYQPLHRPKDEREEKALSKVKFGVQVKGKKQTAEEANTSHEKRSRDPAERHRVLLIAFLYSKHVS